MKVSVALDPEHLTYLEKLGNGNRSLGLRMLVDEKVPKGETAVLVVDKSLIDDINYLYKGDDYQTTIQICYIYALERIMNDYKKVDVLVKKEKYHDKLIDNKELFNAIFEQELLKMFYKHKEQVND